MAGVWSFLIILRVVEAVVAMDMDVVEVRTQNVMSVVNLVILHENVACALAHEAWEVVVVEAPVLAAVEVQVMGMGAGASNVFIPLWGYIYFLDRTLVRNFLVCSLIFLLCLHLHSHKHNAYKSSNRLELETDLVVFFFFIQNNLMILHEEERCRSIMKSKHSLFINWLLRFLVMIVWPAIYFIIIFHGVLLFPYHIYRTKTGSGRGNYCFQKGMELEG